MLLTQDWHIHTHRSLCAKSENTVPAIAGVLDRGGLTLAGLSDHIDAPEQSDRFRGVIEANRADRDSVSCQCRLMIGAEATMLSPTRCALDAATAASLDFTIVACNHYHLDVVENPASRSPEAYAHHHLDMLLGAAEWGHAATVAHPFQLVKSEPELAAATLAAYPESRLAEVLKAGAAADMAFELNPHYIQSALSWFRELVQEARRHGAKFTLGSDSHTLASLGFNGVDGDPSPVSIIESIGLQPTDLKWPKG
ncbi:MAG: hypothetical protein GY851_01565 [bacterium]|nr:hypothetical protein [bacterium]